MNEIRTLANKILKKDRRAIAQGITLVESSRLDHREEALCLIDLLSKSDNKSLRIGLSGTPGVGKSTFIEKFGLMLILLNTDYFLFSTLYSLYLIIVNEVASSACQ